jgi:SAM-dependent methyltransferase
MAVLDEAYDTHAELYASFLDPTLAAPTERLVELAGAGADVRLLDLATGTGPVARAAAGRGARVVAVDQSRGMLDVARRLSPQLDFRVADAHALPFDPAAFDVVTCGLSLSHFRRRDAVLREVLEVLRPGGRFVASAWGPGSCFPTGGIGDLLSTSADEEVTSLDEATWSAAERGAEVLRRAGFTRVATATEFFTGRFADAEQALAWSLAWPLTAADLAALDPAAREELLTVAREALRDADLSWRFAINYFVAMAPDTSSVDR